MTNSEISERFRNLSTPLLADACVRLVIPLRIAPPEIKPLLSGGRLSGRALPARHCGSVDVFLELINFARSGDVMVVDNQGRRDEGCIGDLTVLEAQAAGLQGAVVWGCHRDTAELLEIRFPVWSCGACPCGPVRLDLRAPEALASAQVGSLTVTLADIVFGDDDGLMFIEEERLGAVLTTAEQIHAVEREQAAAVRSGRMLRDQFQFEDYLARRSADASYTFRKHLRRIGGAIEE
jgi:regulator of RNase E activity RraA